MIGFLLTAVIGGEARVRLMNTGNQEFFWVARNRIMPQLVTDTEILETGTVDIGGIMNAENIAVLD